MNASERAQGGAASPTLLEDGPPPLDRYPNRSARAQIVVLPAMGVPAGYYGPFAEALRRGGFDVNVVELRGQGRSAVRASRRVDFGYGDLLREEVARAIERTKRPGCPLFLVGHSLGGHLALMHLGLSPGDAAGVALVAVASPYYRGWTGAHSLRVLASTQAAMVVARGLGYFPGHKLGFGGRQGRSLIRDWAATGRHGRYVANGFERVDFDRAVAALKIPVLSLTLEGDSLAPPRGAEGVTQKLAMADITRVHLDESNAPKESLDHARWARSPDAVVRTLVGWLDGALAR